MSPVAGLLIIMGTPAGESSSCPPALSPTRRDRRISAGRTLPEQKGLDMAPTIDRARVAGDAASDRTAAQLALLERHLAEALAEHRYHVEQNHALLETLTAD